MRKAKIQAVHAELLAVETRAGDPTFPGMSLGRCIVYVPEWSDGYMLWGDLWAVQVGPLLIAQGSMDRWRLFLDPIKCARWLAAV